MYFPHHGIYAQVHQISLNECLIHKSLFKISHNIMEKAMAPHFSTLAWEIPWTEERGGLQSMGS